MISFGETGTKVTHLQYMLAVISEFVPQLQIISITGTFNETTRTVVEAFQAYAGLPVTGVVDRETWNAIYAQFSGIESTVFGNAELFPFTQPVPPAATAAQLQGQLRAVQVFAPSVPAPSASAKMDVQTQRSLAAFQSANNLERTGKADTETKKRLCEQLDTLRYQNSTRFVQFPGYALSFGMRDKEVPII